MTATSQTDPDLAGTQENYLALARSKRWMNLVLLIGVHEHEAVGQHPLLRNPWPATISTRPPVGAHEHGAADRRP